MSECKDNSRKSISITVIAAIIVVLVPVIALLAPAVRSFFSGHPNLVEISRITSIKLPPSSRLAGSELYDWKGQILKAKISIDNADIRPFIKSLKSARTVDKQLAYKMDDGNPKWWNPASVADPLLLFIERPHGTYGRNELRIIIGPADNRATVYLYMEKESR